MIRVGVIGLGMMGSTHLDVYSKRGDAQVVAISDILPERLSGKVKAEGNIEGQAKGGFDAGSVRQYDEGMKLIGDKEVDLVDICLPTPLHAAFAMAALKAGKHVLVEKPFARTSGEAKRLARAAEKAPGMLMCALCMRFWPGWTWLKEAVVEGRYGKVLAATFRRVSSHPGKGFYMDGEQCGGALLDLHIHDVDFIQHVFGMPRGVWSGGYAVETSRIDHVVTRYDYGVGGPLVVAEGSWAMAGGFGFGMHFTVNFERATAVFDLGAGMPLMLYERGQKGRGVELAAGMGYEYEIGYFLECIASGRKPERVTVKEAVGDILIAEAEERSVKTGRRVAIRGVNWG